MNIVKARFWCCLYVGIFVQAFNLFCIWHTFFIEKYFWGALIGGVGRVFVDSILIIFSYKGKEWARYLLSIYWGMTSLVGLYMAYAFKDGPMVKYFWAIVMGVVYILFLYAVLKVTSTPSRRSGTRKPFVPARRP